MKTNYFYILVFGFNAVACLPEWNQQASSLNVTAENGDKDTEDESSLTDDNLKDKKENTTADDFNEKLDKEESLNMNEGMYTNQRLIPIYYPPYYGQTEPVVPRRWLPAPPGYIILSRASGPISTPTYDAPFEKGVREPEVAAVSHNNGSIIKNPSINPVETVYVAPQNKAYTPGPAEPIIPTPYLAPIPLDPDGYNLQGTDVPTRPLNNLPQLVRHRYFRINGPRPYYRHPVRQLPRYTPVNVYPQLFEYGTNVNPEPSPPMTSDEKATGDLQEQKPGKSVKDNNDGHKHHIMVGINEHTDIRDNHTDFVRNIPNEDGYYRRPDNTNQNSQPDNNFVPTDIDTTKISGFIDPDAIYDFNNFDYGHPIYFPPNIREKHSQGIYSPHQHLGATETSENTIKLSDDSGFIQNDDNATHEIDIKGQYHQSANDLAQNSKVDSSFEIPYAQNIKESFSEKTDITYNNIQIQHAPIINQDFASGSKNEEIIENYDKKPKVYNIDNTKQHEKLDISVDSSSKEPVFDNSGEQNESQIESPDIENATNSQKDESLSTESLHHNFKVIENTTDLQILQDSSYINEHSEGNLSENSAKTQHEDTYNFNNLKKYESFIKSNKPVSNDKIESKESTTETHSIFKDIAESLSKVSHKIDSEEENQKAFDVTYKKEDEMMSNKTRKPQSTVINIKINNDDDKTTSTNIIEKDQNIKITTQLQPAQIEAPSDDGDKSTLNNGGRSTVDINTATENVYIQITTDDHPLIDRYKIDSKQLTENITVNNKVLNTPNDAQTTDYTENIHDNGVQESVENSIKGTTEKNDIKYDYEININHLQDKPANPENLNHEKSSENNYEKEDEKSNTEKNKEDNFKYKFTLSEITSDNSNSKQERDENTDDQKSQKENKRYDKEHFKMISNMILNSATVNSKNKPNNKDVGGKDLENPDYKTTELEESTKNNDKVTKLKEQSENETFSENKSEIIDNKHLKEVTVVSEKSTSAEQYTLAPSKSDTDSNGANDDDDSVNDSDVDNDNFYETFSASQTTNEESIKSKLGFTTTCIRYPVDISTNDDNSKNVAEPIRWEFYRKLFEEYNKNHKAVPLTVIQKDIRSLVYKNGTVVDVITEAVWNVENDEKPVEIKTTKIIKQRRKRISKRNQEHVPT